MNDLAQYRVTTNSGGEVNEDLGRVTNHAAWVLDGATGVGDGSFTSGATDAQWYVQRFDHYLQTHIDDYDMELPAVIREGIKTVAAEFSEVVDDPADEITPETIPSAVCAIVRWTNETFESFVLGDCETVLVTSEDEVRQFTDPRPTLARLERECIHGMHQLMTDRGVTQAEARELLRPKVAHDRRKLRNSEENWALCLDPDAANDGQYAQFDLNSIDQVFLCSDGFARLVTTFDTFKNWQHATDWIIKHGIEETIEQLRNIERSDANCTEYPRTKTHDDATSVSVSFI